MKRGLLCLAVACLLPAADNPERAAVNFHARRAAGRPDDAGARRMLASALVKLAEATSDPRDYDRASSALDEAEALEPGNPDNHRVRARLLLSRHRFPQAFAFAEETLRKVPGDADLLGIAGDAAFEMGDLDAAEVRYHKLHAISPQLNTWARLAQLAEARQRLEEAAAHLERAMETGARKGAPAESIAWCRAVLGEIRLKQGDPAAARREYALGLEKFPDHPLVLEHLAELEKLEGNREAAAQAYGRLIALRPDPVQKLRLADVMSETSQAAALRQEARTQIETAVAGGHEGFLRPLAELELEAKRYRRAAELAFRDLGLRPNAEARALLAKILAAAAAAGKPVL
jgi:tetratricopeptide (TPR) repeat protein